MLFQRVESAGLAHYSYLIGDGTQAVVIDPRRDCDVYVRAATQEGMRITRILETHRNEDYVIGSVELAHRTGATIFRSAYSGLDYRYGDPIHDGHQLRIGQLVLQALHTPGHTLGHMSYVLHDPSGVPWMVFSGDALFAGDVGRTDFYGREKLAEMAGLLYDSLFDKILPLGDGVILCPAHGPGSVCGTDIAGRAWTTLGLERKLNAKLQYADKTDFVARVPRMLEYPPYFRKMERLNLEGAPILGTLPSPPPLSPQEFDVRSNDAQVLDTRTTLSFSAAHVPGAISIREDRLPAFAGWYLDYDRPILLVTETHDTTQAVQHLIRLGFDNLAGFLSGGMTAWHTAGLESHRIGTITVQELCQRLDTTKDTWLLDLRSDEELAQEGEIPDAQHIHITQLPQHLAEVPADLPLHLFCGSGFRAMIGASLMRRAGRENATVVLGGLAGWNSASCPINWGE